MYGGRQMISVYELTVTTVCLFLCSPLIFFSFRVVSSSATSSQWMLQCADSAFAWRDCPPIEVYWNERGPLVLSRLCRWLPISLRANYAILQESDIDSMLVLMPSLIELDLTDAHP